LDTVLLNEESVVVLNNLPDKISRHVDYPIIIYCMYRIDNQLVSNIYNSFYYLLIKLFIFNGLIIVLILYAFRIPFNPI